MKTDILLDAGTNEAEILEFYLSGQPFGINVQKLKEIVLFDREKLTVLPNEHPCLLGSFHLRDTLINLVDLKQQIGKGISDIDSPERKIVLVCEFSNTQTAFLVDGVNQIHRINWSDLQPLENMVKSQRSWFTGTVRPKSDDVLIIDLERVIEEIFGICSSGAQPDMELSEGPPPDSDPQLLECKIFFAEDSSIIRQTVEKFVRQAGFANLRVFPNGQDCYDAIKALPPDQIPRLLITDIEMPKMDGLTLCRRLKEDPKLSSIKVLVYSSLANEGLQIKCTQVGVDRALSKPQLPELTHHMIQLLQG